ncbi:MAG: MBL fold metallo-hydrolase, partial [Elusimicrobia bacterium]|nr:MBL fold metallo-hydrolase [Elusimicrobiota bacterium]
RTLWCRHHEPDESNRITLTLGCLLIRTPKGKNVLVDAGLSSKYDKNRKFANIYAVSRPKTLQDELKDRGLSREDIRLVVNTHLHFDHAGGDTELDASGKPIPAFSRAKYVIQKDEWADANAPHERNKASYLEENFAPLDEAKQLELVSGDVELEPGLWVLRSGGHTRGHQIVKIESEGRTAVFLGDLIPTRAHLPLPYIMAYDLFPMDTLEIKRGLLAEACAKNWTLVFQHDAQVRASKVAFQDGRYVAKELADAG